MARTLCYVPFLLLVMAATVWAESDRFVPITHEMLLNPDPADWLMSHRTYDFTGYSPLAQINRENVSGLGLAWMRAMDPGPQEIRPLVYRGVMYIANAGGDHLQALDATTGDLIWDYRRQLPEDITEFTKNGDRTRNLAIASNKLIHLTQDAYVIALDAQTGRLLWETQVADYHDYVTHSSGAIIVKDKVLSGRTCYFKVRCFIAAHDLNTGKEVWRFYTSAAEGEPGGDTWGDLPTEKRVHISPWGLPGSYDPDLDLLFWGTAVPGPFTRLARRGTWDVGDKTPCELYSNSTLALDPDDGRLAWYYQFLPCDDWDQDFVQERTLIETVVDPDPQFVRWINPKVREKPQRRKIIVTMGEPGGLFVNDRQTGEFLWAEPIPFENVDKFVISDIDVESGEIFINREAVAKEFGETKVVCGHNNKSWWGWSFSPETGLLYIPLNRSCLQQTANAEDETGTGPRSSIVEPGLSNDADITEVRAINISTGREAWRYSQRAPNAGSTLATGGRLVFFGDLNRRFRAFDADSGKVLWQTILGSQITGYPITYFVDGRQYLAVAVGGLREQRNRVHRYTPELESPVGSNAIVVFALPQKVATSDGGK